MKTETSNELDGVRALFKAFMNERVVDDKLFGYETEFPRKSLYERMADAIGKSALFGLFLGGYRAGRATEVSPKKVEVSTSQYKQLDLANIAAGCGAESGNLGGNSVVVFESKSLELFAQAIERNAQGLQVFPVRAKKREVIFTTANLMQLLEAKVREICHIVKQSATVAAEFSSPAERVAYQLWVQNQMALHSRVLGKWEHVGDRYRGELLRRAEAWLQFSDAIHTVDRVAGTAVQGSPLNSTDPEDEAIRERMADITDVLRAAKVSSPDERVSAVALMLCQLQQQSLGCNGSTHSWTLISQDERDEYLQQAKVFVTVAFGAESLAVES